MVALRADGAPYPHRARGDCGRRRRQVGERTDLRPSARPTALPRTPRLSRTDIPPSIGWRCTSCGDDGVISGWKRSPFDLRRRSTEPIPGYTLQAVIPSDVAATLRSLMLLDTTAERIVFRSRTSSEGIVLAAAEDDLDELIDSVAAEANHELDPRRRKRLDHAFEVLRQVLELAPRSTPGTGPDADNHHPEASADQ